MNKKLKAFRNKRSSKVVEIGNYDLSQHPTKRKTPITKRQYVSVKDVMKFCKDKEITLHSNSLGDFIGSQFSKIRYTTLGNCVSKTNAFWFKDIVGKKIHGEKTHTDNDDKPKLALNPSQLKQINAQAKAWFTLDNGISWFGIDKDAQTAYLRNTDLDTIADTYAKENKETSISF